MDAPIWNRQTEIAKQYYRTQREIDMEIFEYQRRLDLEKLGYAANSVHGTSYEHEISRLDVKSVPECVIDVQPVDCLSRFDVTYGGTLNKMVKWPKESIIKRIFRRLIVSFKRKLRLLQRIQFIDEKGYLSIKKRVK
jgi:hypothetical protein